jgi:DNA mismatch endonuclease (patch repair protein)
MQKIRSEGGKADRELGKRLWRMGLRYRRKSTLPGKPDLVFTRARLVVFVDGDFWHGRYLNLHIEKRQFSNEEYWIPKLKRTIERDRKVTEDLRADGWRVMRFWESEVFRNIDSIASLIAAEVKSRVP